MYSLVCKKFTIVPMYSLVCKKFTYCSDVFFSLQKVHYCSDVFFSLQKVHLLFRYKANLRSSPNPQSYISAPHPQGCGNVLVSASRVFHGLYTSTYLSSIYVFTSLILVRFYIFFFILVLFFFLFFGWVSFPF